MSLPTKDEALRTFFVFVQDTNTGRIQRIAMPGDVQIGLMDNPSSLELFGRLALSTKEVSTTSSDNSGIFVVGNHDTVVAVSKIETPVSGRISVYLPANPRNGQLHFIKDASGTSDVIPIDLIPASGALIDGETIQTIETQHGSIAVFWSKTTWYVLVAGSGGGVTPASGASYLTVDDESTSLSGSRQWASSANINFTDGGVGSTFSTDLTDTAVSPGTYSVSTFTVDQKGRVTAASSGSPQASASSSFITISNEPGLSHERALAAGFGIGILDGGAGSSVTIFSTQSTADVSASYVVIGVTGSLPNERALAAGPGISFTDGGAGGTLTITNVGTPGSGADVSASYITVGNTGSLPNERALAIGSALSLIDGGAGSSITLDLSPFNKFQLTQIPDVSASYVTIGNTGSLPNERGLVAGYGINFQDGGANDKLIISFAGTLSSSGGSGADVSASYVTIGNTGSLPNERGLAVGTGLSLVDGGAGASVTLDISPFNKFQLTQIPDVSASYVTVGNTGSLPNERALTAGYGVNFQDGGAGDKFIISFLGSISGSSGGGGADVSASYVIIGNTGSLPNERALTAGAGISITDNGPNSTVVIAATGGSGGAGEVSASYVVLGLTSSLANERVLTAGTGITITDGGPNGPVTITANPFSVGSPNAFYGFTTSSVYWSVTSSWTSVTSALGVGGFTDNITQSISRSGSDFLVTGGGLYSFHAGFNAYGSDAYVSLRLRQSGTTNVALQRSTYRSIPTDQNLVVLDGIFSSAAGVRWTLEYVSSGTIFPWTSSNPTVSGGDNMVTGEVKLFLLPNTPAATSLFSIPILAGTVTTNTAHQASKQSLGMAFYNSPLIQNFGGASRRFYYRAIVDVTSVEANMSASVDLYDLNAIVAFPPGIITGSIISSSIGTATQIQVELTSLLQSVTGSGIFESRLWRTVSGSLASSVTCRNARIDVEYS